GFIGHHLVKRLKSEGHWVRGVDIKYPEYDASAGDAFEILDLRKVENCLLATRGGIDEVYNLAADMGGIGYITAYLADISRNNILINAHMLEASRQNAVQRFLFSSSACVYNQSKQQDAAVTPLREEDAHPADPEPGYGWEKLFARNSAVTTTKTTALRRGLSAFTTSTGRLARTKAARKRRQPPSVARWLSPKIRARSKCGVMASRHAPLCMWIIVWKDLSGSWLLTTATLSIWERMNS